MKVLVTGATGFVGPAVANAIVDAGHEVRVLERTPGSWRKAGIRCQEAVQGDMTDADTLRRAAADREVVVHLVAIRQGKPEQFQRIMVEGTRNLLAASTGAKRFVLMSALGTTEETKDLVPYYGAKWQEELDVKASGLEHVIFRPSFIFGRDGGILPTFLKLAKLAPVTGVVGSGKQRIQPIWIDDLGAYFAASVDKPEAAGQTFELGGPDIVDWDELWRRIRAALGIAAAADDAPADRADEDPRDADRAPAGEHPAHARPAHHARDGRQRRLERPRGAHVRHLARPTGRADPPRGRLIAAERAVAAPPERVFDFLADLRNHWRLERRFLSSWTSSARTAGRSG